MHAGFVAKMAQELGIFLLLAVPETLEAEGRASPTLRLPHLTLLSLQFFYMTAVQPLPLLQQAVHLGILLFPHAPVPTLDPGGCHTPLGFNIRSWWWWYKSTVSYGTRT